MTLMSVVLSSCLMFSTSPSVVKKCENIIKKECGKNEVYFDCFKKVAPKINVVMKKQYLKACALQ